MFRRTTDITSALLVFRNGVAVILWPWPTLSVLGSLTETSNSRGKIADYNATGSRILLTSTGVYHSSPNEHMHVLSWLRARWTSVISKKENGCHVQVFFKSTAVKVNRWNFKKMVRIYLARAVFKRSPITWNQKTRLWFSTSTTLHLPISLTSQGWFTYGEIRFERLDL